MPICNYRIVCDECGEELECRTIDHSSYEDVIFVKPCKNCGRLTAAAPDAARCPACGGEMVSTDVCLICQYVKEPRR